MHIRFGDAEGSNGSESGWVGRLIIRKINVDQFDGIWDRFGFGSRSNSWPNSSPTLRDMPAFPRWPAMSGKLTPTA
ncbi:hypothetical protein CG716_26845 [Mycolicibacterium sphagni]|uniref:Uncharacterized protein n=1 Tax=Mycolicibacterium sphagni TaxID=1786 RepID=A0A255D6C0_9MYCO|nr:hypothetical protein CG716_26845 [Mycolicibacterium sphagni]